MLGIFCYNIKSCRFVILVFAFNIFVCVSADKMNPFRKGRNKNSHLTVSGNKFSRQRRYKHTKRVKLRENVGIINVKNSVGCALLNVDGYSEETLVDVRHVTILIIILYFR